MRLFALEVSSRDMIPMHDDSAFCDYDTSNHMITHNYGSNLHGEQQTVTILVSVWGTSDWRDPIRYAQDERPRRHMHINISRTYFMRNMLYLSFLRSINVT